MRKNPSSRRRKARGPYRVNDSYRKPFPDLKVLSLQSATYEITPLGRVWRDDGFLLRPHVKDLSIKLNRGRVQRSLPMAVYKAFGRTPRPSDLYTPWVRPDSPIDELTGRRSCAVRYVKLVHHGDLIRLARGTIKLDQIKTLKIR